MIIFNVKFKLKAEVENEWFTWMSTKHIPDVINTGHFLDYTFMKLLLNGSMDPATVTYEIQYVCRNQKELDSYLGENAEGLRQQHAEKFGQYIINTSRSQYEDVTEKMLALS